MAGKAAPGIFLYLEGLLMHNQNMPSPDLPSKLCLIAYLLMIEGFLHLSTSVVAALMGSVFINPLSRVVLIGWRFLKGNPRSYLCSVHWVLWSLFGCLFLAFTALTVMAHSPATIWKTQIAALIFALLFILKVWQIRVLFSSEKLFFPPVEATPL